MRRNGPLLGKWQTCSLQFQGYPDLARVKQVLDRLVVFVQTNARYLLDGDLDPEEPTPRTPSRVIHCHLFLPADYRRHSRQLRRTIQQDQVAKG